MIVGYFLSTWYKKELAKQKEKQINKRPVSNKTSEEIFKELQKALRTDRSDQDIKVKPKPVAMPAKSANTPAKSMSHVPMKKEKMVLEAFADFSNRPRRQTIQPSKLKQSSKRMTENVNTVAKVETGTAIEFDLRKAVLYSEILKRPQY